MSRQSSSLSSRRPVVGRMCCMVLRCGDAAASLSFLLDTACARRKYRWLLALEQGSALCLRVFSRLWCTGALAQANLPRTAGASVPVKTLACSCPGETNSLNHPKRTPCRRRRRAPRGEFWSPLLTCEGHHTPFGIEHRRSSQSTAKAHTSVRLTPSPRRPHRGSEARARARRRNHASKPSPKVGTSP